MGYPRLTNWVLVALGVFGLSSAPRALASDDTFGHGDGHLGAKTVSTVEVVNAYSKVASDVSIGDASVEVVDGSKFAAGDLAVIWQVNGYATPASGDQNEITLTGQPVGRFELARIDSVASNVLNLSAPMNASFTAASSQVVFIPEYTDVTVEAAGEIRAADWDPAAVEGGVVVFFATGTVTVDGRVTANGAGFLGGTDLGDSGANGCTGLDEPSPTGAEKGESISGLDFISGDPPGGTGRGNRANGGGGGVCHNSGGAGGGHGGLGGLGGRTWRGDPDPVIPDTGRDIGGMGGAPIAYTALSHMTMGGGGGAGQQNNDLGGAGSDGGGVVFVRAGAVAGAGSFEANGDDGGDSAPPYNDSAGGAGAGGLVIVRAVGDLSCGAVSATGGEGGTALFDDHGTGGGGAGGHTLLQGATVSCAVDVSGGTPGVQTDLTDPPGESYGALPGEAGDEESVASSLQVDADLDGLWDVFEQPGDTDGDGLPDYLDDDDDGDGIPTFIEGSDPNGDRDPSDATDRDGDGLPDYLDIDSDGDGIPDALEAGNSLPRNTDMSLVGGDGFADYLDIDSDADGINDTDEAFDTDDDGLAEVAPAGNDHDADGLDDAFDGDCVGPGNPTGCLVAGAPMTVEGAPDDDGDGLPNWLEGCGDGYLTAVPAYEACDDGDGDDTNECNNACRFNAGHGACADENDCADPSGMSCDAMSALCQLQNGNGPCSEATEIESCTSGVCDEGSSTCESCADHADCAMDERCENNTCVVRTCGDGVTDPGEACDDGDDDDGNDCANTCLFNAGRGPCATEEDCAGNTLVCDQPDGVCRFPLGAGDCDEPSESDVCAGGVCDASSGTCEACADNDDCGSSERCESNECVPAACGDGILDVGETCDDGSVNGPPPARCANDCAMNTGAQCSDDDDCTRGSECGEDDVCAAGNPRSIDSDGDGIPDSLDPDRFSISGGRGAGCHVGGYDAGTPTNVLLLLLALFLGTRRYRRN